MTTPLGPLVRSFFIDHLPMQKGLRQSSIRSYRDTIRLFLCFVSEQRGNPITTLAADDLCFEQVLAFLKYLEQQRGNCVRTRNQRRAALNTFFTYLALRMPEMLAACQQIAAIPVKRTTLPDTHYLEREEVTALFRSLPREVASRFVIARSCCFSTTPAHGYRKPPICALSISTLTHRPRCICTARETSGVSARCGRRLQGISGSSRPNGASHPSTPSLLQDETAR